MLILASHPRRRELLLAAGLEFMVRAVEIDESIEETNRRGRTWRVWLKRRRVRRRWGGMK